MPSTTDLTQFNYALFLNGFRTMMYYGCAYVSYGMSQYTNSFDFYIYYNDYLNSASNFQILFYCNSILESNNRFKVYFQSYDYISYYNQISFSGDSTSYPSYPS